MRLELTRVGLLFELANHYTTRPMGKNLLGLNHQNLTVTLTAIPLSKPMSLQILIWIIFARLGGSMASY